MDSHSKYGFDEPFKYYNPSIGISEIVFLSERKSFDKKIVINDIRLLFKSGGKSGNYEDDNIYPSS